MKQPWWALTVLALVGAGLGVGSALLLGGEGDATSTVEPAGTLPAPGTTDAESASTEPATTTTSSPRTSSTTTAATTTTSVATTTSTTTSTLPQPPLDEIVIVVANGAGAPGLAARNVAALRDAGYPSVEGADGAEIFGGTVIYVEPGLEPTADRVLADLQAADPDFADPSYIVPIDRVPTLTPARAGARIVVYLGDDQVPAR